MDIYDRSTNVCPQYMDNSSSSSSSSNSCSGAPVERAWLVLHEEASPALSLPQTLDKPGIALPARTLP
ncbi:hypothetical protein C8034_v000762 [Colletotrichum sidae]|uniref:Uncharacterized protein n=1 Tax=Colletotrichum sidae TaxID=1347389 RepID=A0A4V3I3N6_9PEZI|nr:hypothetical protein C8034_v000762 [Colletotrichum sidae]